jgi:hypothetical protein
VAGERVVPSDGVPGFLEPSGELGKAVDEQSRMGLASGDEGLFDAEVDLQAAAAEPAAAPRGQRFGFVEFAHAQQATPELSAGLLPVTGYRELDVVDREKGEGGSAVPSLRMGLFLPVAVV